MKNDYAKSQNSRNGVTKIECVCQLLKNVCPVFSFDSFLHKFNSTEFSFLRIGLVNARKNTHAMFNDKLKNLMFREHKSLAEISKNILKRFQLNLSTLLEVRSQ